MKKKMTYEEYLEEDQCILIKVMGVETIMRDLCDYYEYHLDPFAKRAFIYAHLDDAYKKILRSHEKLRGVTK